MTAHLVRADQADHDAFIDRLNEGLDERFGINHPTVQIEHGDACDHDCNDRAPHGHLHAHGHPHADAHAHAGADASRHP
jgi:cobalt-zinc-cadmium efflux system protein